ncbi:MAG TPA: helix-turn-helix domain-containing protein [Candidatus Paceibacterota bacterium]|nr:helix-turn-helix domain-containing protein [Candidatus Paceibacterota bacterium]HMP19031.1 helix-turn-helix domain-containing protein [Candidatus Paceibacterota bacterium]HMP85204.1 helix-turn-helix domain-containing protein [Candidatus Paceibacterota bacterium]
MFRQNLLDKFTKKIITTNMQQEILNSAGLTTEQSKIYTTLLENGSMQARKIVLNTGIKRGLVYKALDQLIEMGLVTKHDSLGKISVFNPNHPNLILKIIEEKKKNLETIEDSVKSVVGQMTSSFNLLTGKPNVRFYEGEKGLKEVLDDSLYSKSEVLSYADLESIEKFIPEINKKHVADRKKHGVIKKAMVLDSEFNRKVIQNYDKEVTNVRFMDVSESKPFQSLMNIYDNKVSYLTLDTDRMIGVIIEDEHIAEMQRYIWEFSWKNAKD